MTKTEAHELLNAVRAGQADGVTEAEITRALWITGDLDDDWGPIRVHKPVGTWERRPTGTASWIPA